MKVHYQRSLPLKVLNLPATVCCGFLSPHINVFKQHKTKLDELSPLPFAETLTLYPSHPVLNLQVSEKNRPTQGREETRRKDKMSVQPQIILLREGTDTSQGMGQLISNINACLTIVDTIKTTLGPRGLDKLITTNGNTTISNDGATVMKCLEIAHPAAKTLIEIAKAQDTEVGDGTTSVVILAGEFLREAKQFVEDGVHPQIIIRAYRQACEFAVEHIKKIAAPLGDSSEYDLLRKCAQTALNSKLINHEKGFFAKMAVDAVLALGEGTDLDLIGIKKVQGGSMTDSILVRGVAFERTFSYAGFEQQPKSFENPSILMLNLELELKAEKDNAEIRVKNPDQYQAIIDAEWRIIYEKLEACVASGAKVCDFVNFIIKIRFLSLLLLYKYPFDTNHRSSSRSSPLVTLQPNTSQTVESSAQGVSSPMTSSGMPHPLDNLSILFWPSKSRTALSGTFLFSLSYFFIVQAK